MHVIHGPVHASWLNQIEIYFSIIQRKVLTPNDFPNLEAVADRLEGFERRYEAIARPFEWKFTRAHGFGSEFQKSLRSKIIRDCAGQTAAGRSSWTA